MNQQRAEGLQPPKIKYWIQAIRPQTLAVGIAPVVFTTFVIFSREKSLPPWFLIPLLVVLLLQSAANLINDYIDAEKERDGKDRLGPVRVCSSGLLSISEVKRMSMGLIFLAFILGLINVFFTGMPLLILGIFSCFFAFAYTGGPYPLSLLGLGEIAAFLFFGPLAMLGTEYALGFQPSWQVFLLSMPFGILSALLMSINNHRDRNQDKENGKKTISVRLGKNAFLAPIFLYLALILFHLLNCILETLSWWSLIALLPLILLSSKKSLIMAKTPSKKLNLVLAAVGKGTIFYTTLLILSWKVHELFST